VSNVLTLIVPGKNQLEASPNPFATVVMAHLKAKETWDDQLQRKRWKFDLPRRLYEKGYDRQDILNLYCFIDWLLNLPKELELEFRHEIEQYEQEGHMPYVSSIERMARQEGKQEEVEALLKAKFGELDDALVQILEPLMQLSASGCFAVALCAKRAHLILQLSKEELIAHFQA
jgi:hypothetical protein